MHFGRQTDSSRPLGPKTGECYAHPPSAQVIMSVSALGQPSPQVIPVFPPRPADAKACGEWIEAAAVESLSSPVRFPFGGDAA